MEINPAILELAKQLTALQEENKTLKEQLVKPVPKKGKKQEQFERVSRWVNEQYAKGFEKAIKRKEKEIKSIQEVRPDFVPINDCKWPSSNTLQSSSKKPKETLMTLGKVTLINHANNQSSL